MAWNNDEIKKIAEMVDHLNGAVQVALGVTIKFNAEEGTVFVFNENNKFIRAINIKDDSVYGAFKDITDNL